MSIDFSRPIETTDGREARYIGPIPQPHIYSWTHAFAACDGNGLWWIYHARDDGTTGMGNTTVRNVEPEVKQYQNQYQHADKLCSWKDTIADTHTAEFAPWVRIGIMERTLKGGKLVGEPRYVPEREWRASQ